MQRDAAEIGQQPRQPRHPLLQGQRAGGLTGQLGQPIAHGQNLATDLGQTGRLDLDGGGALERCAARRRQRRIARRTARRQRGLRGPGAVVADPPAVGLDLAARAGGIVFQAGELGLQLLAEQPGPLLEQAVLGRQGGPPAAARTVEHLLHRVGHPPDGLKAAEEPGVALDRVDHPEEAIDDRGLGTARLQLDQPEIEVGQQREGVLDELANELPVPGVLGRQHDRPPAQSWDRCSSTSRMRSILARQPRTSSVSAVIDSKGLKKQLLAPAANPSSR